MEKSYLYKVTFYSKTREQYSVEKLRRLIQINLLHGTDLSWHTLASIEVEALGEVTPARDAEDKIKAVALFQEITGETPSAAAQES